MPPSTKRPTTWMSGWRKPKVTWGGAIRLPKTKKHKKQHSSDDGTPSWMQQDWNRLKYKKVLPSSRTKMTPLQPPPKQLDRRRNVAAPVQQTTDSTTGSSSEDGPDISSNSEEEEESILVRTTPDVPEPPLPLVGQQSLRLLVFNVSHYALRSTRMLFNNPFAVYQRVIEGSNAQLVALQEDSTVRKQPLSPQYLEVFCCRGRPSSSYNPTELRNTWLVHRDASGFVQDLKVGHLLDGCKTARCGVIMEYDNLRICNVQLCGIQEILMEGFVQGKPEIEDLLATWNPDILVIAGPISTEPWQGPDV